jgi:hypothetical protein
MKNIKILLAVLTFIATSAFAEEYKTGCYFEISGDRTGYKLKKIEAESITEFLSPQDITPSECLSKAVIAVKQKYPSKYLAGGQLRDCAYFNKVATVNIIHKDNVDFPKQQLETYVVQDEALTLKKGFEFVEAWIDDNYFQAKIGYNSKVK